MTTAIEEVEANTDVEILSDVVYRVTMQNNFVKVTMHDASNPSKQHHIEIELPMNPSGTFISKKKKGRVLGTLPTNVMMAIPKGLENGSV